MDPRVGWHVVGDDYELGSGLAAAFFRLPPRKFVLVSTAAFVLVAVGALIQRAIMPPAPVFFNPRVIFQEKAFTQIELEKHGLQRWSLADDARSVLLTSAVAPPPRLEDDPTPFGVFRLVTNQHSPPTQSLVGAGAIVCWIFLLGVGLWGAWRTLSHRAVALAVGSFALFQLAMHLVYGEITFLYALNFFPALLTLAAFGWLTPLRKYVTCAAFAFAVLAGINNYGQFLTTVRLVNEIVANYPERYRHVRSSRRNGCANECSVL